MFNFSKNQQQPTEEKSVFFTKLKTSLKKTRANLFDSLLRLKPNQKIDSDFLHDLEDRLLIADVGIEATTQIITELEHAAKHDQLNNQQQLYSVLAQIMIKMLKPLQPHPLTPSAHTTKPLTILLMGINGAGKTTTAGKLAYHFRNQGYSIMLAAGDTFRAAATEQLQAWGARSQVPVIAQKKGADPAAVIHNAVKSAQKNKIDILIADTAGRLHTQDNLMQQLKKIRRTISKLDAAIVVENMFVLDGTTGQNALSQVQLFNDAVNIDSVVLTKLDGTAKGGTIFSLAQNIGVTVQFISTGEKINDLHPFDSKNFVEALLED